jgi:large subunit ribosomal protein L2
MYCAITLSVDKLMDSQCQATIGIMFNLCRGKHKLHKVEQNQWLSRRPIVWGVAMTPVDHPHGGGERLTKGVDPQYHLGESPTKVDLKQ